MSDTIAMSSETITNDHLKNIRNICVIAHVDHGKSSLTDTLVAAAKIISEDDAGTKRFTDNREDEADRGITIKSTGVAMTLGGMQVNLVDTPGHVDFNAEVTAAIRITDGCVVLVDSVEGVCVQTESVLIQALTDRLKPVLVINKIDRYFTQLQLTGEEAYTRLCEIIAKVNNMLTTYQPESTYKLCPNMGNVFFTCARYNWGFNIKTFSDLYSKKTGKSADAYMKILWGEYYFNPATKQMSKNPQDGTRCFNHFIYNPINEAFNVMLGDQYTDSRAELVFESAFITVLPEDMLISSLDERQRKIFKRCYPLANMLVDGIRNFLPSPVDAQKYRVDVLYNGPHDTKAYNDIKNCNPAGDLIIYISKMIPTGEGGTFYAFGRIFSGTVHVGQKVTILGTNYEHGSNNDVFNNKSIQSVIKLVGNRIERVEQMECGNTVALLGIDGYLAKSGTITNSKDLYPIKTMQFSVSPVVRVAVAPKNAADTPKFAEGLKRLSKTDPCLQVRVEENGEFIVAAAGELHMEIAINDLRGILRGMEIIVSTPVVPYCETIAVPSRQACMSKSPNKHNRLTAIAEPLPEEFVKFLENGKFTHKDYSNVAKIMSSEHNIDGKLWAIDDTNVLLDCTRGALYMNEIKDSVVSGFKMLVQHGPLCNEPLRGVCFKILDVTLHADAIHRGAGQIAPTARRTFSACMLCANPRFVEPIFAVTISVHEDYKGTIYSCVNQRRGSVEEEIPVLGTPMWTLKGFLPVAESFGFDKYIKQETSGKALPSCKFSHWTNMTHDPMAVDSIAYKILMVTRKNRNLKVELPDFDEFNDKL